MEPEEFAIQIEDTLNRMSRDELIVLNREIVKRIKTIDGFIRLKANTAFNPGDNVSWRDKQGYPHIGQVIRINTKTISVKEENNSDGIWRITATALKKIDE